MKDEKKSIIKEALSDYNEIMEAADANAMKKLAKEFPEKFNNLLKEELQTKNNLAKESYKKVDVPEIKKESVMEKKLKETVKVVSENAGDEIPFSVKSKKSLQNEEFDITGLDDENVDSALENSDEDDEVLTMEEIEREISDMDSLGEELKGIDPTSPSYVKKDNGGIAFDELVNMRNKLDEIIKNTNVDEMHQGKFDLANMHQGNYDDHLIDEKSVDEMHQGNFPLDKMHGGDYDDSLIDEESPITDADIEAVLGNQSDETDEEPVDETHGMAYANRRNSAGRHLPAPDYLSKGELDQSPEYVQESKKKIGGLILENKKLTKKLNDTKKYKESVSGLVESYKSALEKYRSQLKEMAIFNTNLAHVNNLLVNEELALTQNDKIKIINEFKKIDSIASSQNMYKSFLTEMKGSKKTITESIEEKVSASIQPSSRHKLDEVVEKTAYENNDHIKRMRQLIETIEHRGKKNNL